MLKNYLKIALRSLWRNKTHSAINILGLSLGIACCLLIVLFVKDEWTFDTFHSKSDRIYRVYVKEDYGENQTFFNTVTPFPMGPVLKENFAEVESQVRVNSISSIVKINENQFTETVTLAGQDFFHVFDFKNVKGQSKATLQDQSGVVITNRYAKKYFGETDPINKVISIQIGENFEEFFVKGVVEDVPTNSSIQFNVLISDLNYPKLYNQQLLTSAWFNVIPETYGLLREGAVKASLQDKFPTLFKSVLGEESFKESNYSVGLQPLTDIHLNTDFPVGNAPVSNPKYAYILAAIALLILFVACINFVTLSIGRSLKRAKEVGIRKVVGAVRRQLIFQFVGEAMIITIISLQAGLALALANLPLFNDLSGKQLIFPTDSFMIAVLAGLIVIIGLIAGSYPAFVLSAFKPISILKGAIQSGSGKQSVRKILVGIQLVLSIFLISSTIIMQNQLSFLQNKNLGFNKDQMAVIQLNVPRGGRMAERVNRGFEMAEQFKPELARIAGVSAICASSHDFGNGGWVNVGYTDDKGVYRTFNINTVDDDYIPVMKMEITAGRNFSADIPADKRRSIIINEAFAKEYGWDDPLGKKIPGKDFAEHEVVGVVKDFHYESLYTKVQPVVFMQDPAIILSGIENINVNNTPLPKLMVRLRAGDIASTMEKIKQQWSTLTKGEEFAFSFMDQAIMTQYRNDANLGKIVRIATLLAIFIGSLGLYGLASLAMQNRVKEISIRKILGATERSLLILLSKEYVYLIMICLMISVPMTWYMMQQWLHSFEYKISIGVDSFLLAGGISLLIAFFTISYQTIKTAWTQPADTLKYE
ncbi:MAG: ABC transporter permease [Flammeovirgaceae bacterium]|nr:ABC transporter permease [Flammeovirgaceae bacterium]